MKEEIFKRLSGHIAVITGAARGTGADIARLFAHEGAKVVLTDVLEDELRAVAAEIGPDARACPADVSSAAGWQAIVETAHEFGPVSILVNNAAVLHVAKLQNVEPDAFERLFRVNQLGPLLGMQAVMPDMVAAGAGSIVNIGSVDGMSAQDIGLCAYSATKWALRGLTKAAALELGRHGIRVNCVHPDGGNPQMSAPFFPPEWQPEKAMAAHVHQILAPARGRPRNNRIREIANMVLFLASDEGAGCTGGDYPVDGGYTAGRRLLPDDGAVE